MRPQKQRYRYAAPGRTGDCHRTCIAMILNMDRDAVPHFMDGLPTDGSAADASYAAAELMELQWLARRGLTSVHIAVPGEADLATILEMNLVQMHGAPVVLGCTSSANLTQDHSVVIYRGAVYNPNSGGVGGPMRDGMWWLTIYSVGPNWRSPRWQDRLLGLFRLR
jgi:hypothetical protein